MARFYDPRDEAELLKVEAVLRKGGIEYFLRKEMFETGMIEIHVAEEDIFRAEELLAQSGGR